MKNIILTAIRAGGYKLDAMHRTIAKMYALGSITAEDMDELIILASQNAQAESERPGMIELIAKLSDRMEALEKRVHKLEGGEDETTGDEGSTGEYPAWEPWDGISNKYQPGAVVSHNGFVWESVHTGQNVWEPGVMGTESMWVVYEPEAGTVGELM